MVFAPDFMSATAKAEILLVTEVDSVVSFIHLECAPYGCIGYLLFPIITNSDAHSRPICKYSL
jgi:hypothetical protein